MLFCLLRFILTEVFEFKDNRALTINFRLERENISTGFFKLYPNTKAHFNVEIVSTGRDKKYFSGKLENEEEKHFSFSNKDMEDVQVVIRPITPIRSGEQEKIRMLFETKLNTFDKEVALKAQIEPAVYALDKLQAKLNNVIETSKNASLKNSQLGAEHKRMFIVVVIVSFIGLVGYGIFNLVQLSLMKKYLREKKYL